MTVSSTTVKNSFSGDGSTTQFTYTFPINSTAELKVIERSSLGAETVKTLNSDYTIVDNGSSGGTVTFTSAPASGTSIVLLRDTNLTQDTDYVANDPFPAESHETALDKLTLQQQEIQEEIDRSLKLSRTNTMTSTEFTIDASSRANKVLGFDSTGELSVTTTIGSNRGNWASGTAYSVRDIVKDTSTNNIFMVNAAHSSSGAEPLTTNTNSTKYDLLVDAAASTTAQTAAATSATNAATSETNAATSATTATTQASNAATSESNASTSETNAATSASNAATSASNASTSETNASTSETNAASSATSAASSATTATTQASAASTSATNAATSATNAATSETNAASSASSASTSATNAATSASAASTSATNASNSASAAATSAANAEAAYDSFDDRYLGPKASDPTLDNDGDALIDGALYFNTTTNVLKYWDGAAWQNVEAVDTSNFATNGFAIAMAIAL
jgi:hypothetical protein